jgi:ABC-type Fe3+-hydroxamate transport system substrate-binding protein
MAGMTGHRQISLEGIVAMDPDVVVLAQSEIGRPSALDALLANEALQDVRAVRTNRVLRVKWSLTTTLSHWNVVGAEEMLRGLYPEAASLLDE